MANSRLKDFYDLWLVAQTFEFSHSVLANAVRRTFERRGTGLPTGTPTGLTDDFAAAWSTQWRAFIGRERMAAVPDSLAIVVADLRAFLLPLTAMPQVGREWPRGGPWSLGVGGDGSAA